MSISLETVEREHRQGPAKECRRLALGLVTRDERQAENSLISIDATIRIVDSPVYTGAHQDSKKTKL